MSMTDPIADFLTHIRNANLVRHRTVELPASNLKFEVARILAQEGYISSYEEAADERGHRRIRVELKYSPQGERVIHGLKRVSKPGCRIYTTVDEIPKVLGGLGVSILSTSRGLLTGAEAKSAHVGGEVLCAVW